MGVFNQGPAPEDHFTMISNDLLRNPNLSIEARGIYGFMRSHRDGWKMTTERIGEACNMSRKRSAKYINELIDAGFIIRDQANDGGKFGEIHYLILAEPQKSSPQVEPVGQNVTTVGDALGRNVTTPPTSENDTLSQVGPMGRNAPDGKRPTIRRPIPKKTNKEEGVTASATVTGGHETTTIPPSPDDSSDGADGARPSGTVPSDWSTPDDPRCRDHAGLPRGEVPACRLCGNAREWFEAQASKAERERRVERDACGFCDERGFAWVRTHRDQASAVKCSHQGPPSLPEPEPRPEVDLSSVKGLDELLKRHKQLPG